MSQQNAVTLLRSQYQTVQNGWLEPTMQGVTAAQAHWQAPGGRAAPIGAQYAHHILGLDFLILGFVRKGAPLAATSFAGKAGVSEPFPTEGDWNEWARRVRVDLDALHQYAQAVYSALDAQLAEISDDDLATPVDMTPVGLGQQTLGSILTIMLIHGAAHTGEISVTKGLQGLKGYPF
jgi:DinB superfamily